MNQGYSSEEVDPEDIDAYFWHVFSRLPDEVMVYPSENYYYFVDCIRGHADLGKHSAAGRPRERSVLSFAYAEFVEFPTGTDPYLSRAKYFTEADALTIQEIDKFTFLVKFNRRSVLFRLYKLSQEPPKLFSLRPHEVFVERTFDESGSSSSSCLTPTETTFPGSSTKKKRCRISLTRSKRTSCLDGAPGSRFGSIPTRADAKSSRWFEGSALREMIITMARLTSWPTITSTDRESLNGWSGPIHLSKDE
jgi:hypothetical protein